MNNYAMEKIEFFKAKVDTKKFKKGQTVWITRNEANHINIVSKWRGKGRYVEATLAKWDSKYEGYNRIIGDEGIKTMEVEESFANRINNY